MYFYGCYSAFSCFSFIEYHFYKKTTKKGCIYTTILKIFCIFAVCDNKIRDI